METLVLVLKIFYGVFFAFAGIMHIIKPKIFKYFTPPFLPLKLTNYLAGVVEFALGIGLFFLNTIEYAALGIFYLMIVFLPIHIWDATKIRPAIGSKTLAYIRIPFQFVLMYGAYIIYTNS